MGFHYGYEKRKFDAEWTRLEQEYRAAGMDDRQIAAMKEYDWTWFCSQRTYQNRVQALPSEQCEDESEQSCLFRKFESLSYTWDTGAGDDTEKQSEDSIYAGFPCDTTFAAPYLYHQLAVFRG